MKKEKIEISGYSAPECTVVNIETEGILCASGDNDGSVINDFVEKDYDGWV